MEAIGVYVRTLRDERGFTQEGLARLVGISEKTMRNLESGRHDPKIETLAQIVTLVRGSLAHVGRLMDPSAPIELARQLADEVLSNGGFTDEQRVYLESLTPDQKRALLTVAREMKQ